MVLIEVRNSDGVVGRCDAKCYTAKTPKCECICGGMNHGAGESNAIDNTREYAEEWIEAYDEKNPGFSYHKNPSVDQLTLF